MFRPWKRAARSVLENLSTYHPRHREALEIVRAERAAPPGAVPPERRHLNAAIAWIRRAQNAAGDGGGVAWGYRARRPVRSRDRLGWIGPYPETTGYIIPTMLRYARLEVDPEASRSARRMADWELSIQLPDGGIQGGIYGDQAATSSTFVTGQVLFGLMAAFREWGDITYQRAAIRAGDYLLECLDDTGRFQKGYSRFCAGGPKAYEVRTGLALAELGVMLERDTYKQAASRIADYALSCQDADGWFRENDLDFHDRPLTHTIGYALEGLHGLGVLLHRQDCLEAAARTLNRIAALVREDGFLAGRWFSGWKPAVDWACLTGSSQIAGVLIRIQDQCGNSAWLDAGRRLLGFVCCAQDIPASSPGLAGGIRGSYPFHGDYGQWCVLNWATKFFADSVMDYLQLPPVAGVR